jgi:hypothetical protein
MRVRQFNPCTFACAQSASRARAGAARLGGASPLTKARIPVNSRRMDILPAVLLSPAISLGSRLSSWVESSSAAVGARTAPTGHANSLPTVRELEVRGTVEELGLMARAGQAPSPAAGHGFAAHTPTSPAYDVGRSSSSRSEQIPLSVGTVDALETVLRPKAIRSSRRHVDRKRLNLKSSLQRGAV